MTNILSVARDNPHLLGLAESASTSHETAEEWYDAFGWHLSTERAGDVTLQVVGYADLATQTDDEIVAQLLADDEDLTRDEAESIVAKAREVAESADEVEAALAAAVGAYRAGDRSGTIDAIVEASRIESRNGGDDPAAQALAEQLLAPAYVVMVYPDGCAASYVGTYYTLDKAREAMDSATGATPEHLWETARASRNPGRGCDYPPELEDGEPIEWGDDSRCICRVAI